MKYEKLSMEGNDRKLINDNILSRKNLSSPFHSHKSTSQLSSMSTPPGNFLRILVDGKSTACFHNRLPCGKNVFRTLAFARDLIRFAMSKLALCNVWEGVFIYIFTPSKIRITYSSNARKYHESFSRLFGASE